MSSHRHGRRTGRRCCAALACAVAVLTTGSCYRQSTDRAVKVSYDQVANFSSYHVNQDDPPVKSPGELFIMYRITQIRNTGLAAVPFTFAQDRTVVISPIKAANNKTSKEQPEAAPRLLGDRLLDKLQVKPGKVVAPPGCFIKTMRSESANVLIDALVPLTYENESDSEQPTQKVMMRREPADNVATVVTQATPVSLRGLCS